MQTRPRALPTREENIPAHAIIFGTGGGRSSLSFAFLIFQKLCGYVELSVTVPVSDDILEVSRTFREFRVRMRVGEEVVAVARFALSYPHGASVFF